MLFLSSFFSKCSLLDNYLYIFIIYFWRKLINLECYYNFFFYSGLRGFDFYSSYSYAFCSSYHIFSDRIWLLNLLSNLYRLKAYTCSFTIGSIFDIFLSTLLFMTTLSTCFSLNLTISTPYFPDLLSNKLIECRLMV